MNKFTILILSLALALVTASTVIVPIMGLVGFTIQTGVSVFSYTHLVTSMIEQGTVILAVIAVIWVTLVAIMWPGFYGILRTKLLE